MSDEVQNSEESFPFSSIIKFHVYLPCERSTIEFLAYFMGR